jgi:hypothetical protein
MVLPILCAPDVQQCWRLVFSTRPPVALPHCIILSPHLPHLVVSPACLGPQESSLHSLLSHALCYPLALPRGLVALGFKHQHPYIPLAPLHASLALFSPAPLTFHTPSSCHIHLTACPPLSSHVPSLVHSHHPGCSASDTHPSPSSRHARFAHALLTPDPPLTLFSSCPAVILLPPPPRNHGPHPPAGDANRSEASCFCAISTHGYRTLHSHLYEL